MSDRPPPLYMKIARSLLGDIARGRLRTGDRLPTEDDLIAAFGVSRVTVRQAFDVLRRRGLVERIAGRGSFVTSPPGAYVMTIASIEDVVQAGADTDIRIIEWKAVRPAPAVERRLHARRAYVLRSVRSREGAPLCYSETYTTIDIGRRIERAELVRRTVLETIESKLGIQIGSAAEEISGAVADRALARHLSVPRGAPIVIVEMTFVDVEDRPIEYFKTCYRADQFRRRNRLKRLRPQGDRR
ncbi:MAG: GntR family transcriptional regulator [Candidatus Rokuibacteriota bacterium]